jgi:y4mF family transcriptional regulator
MKNMLKKEDNLEKIAQMVREKRKSSGLTQATAAVLCGVGTRFFVELEKGKQSLHIGKVIRVLNGLGLVLDVRMRGSR